MSIMLASIVLSVGHVLLFKLYVLRKVNVDMDGWLDEGGVSYV